MNWYTSQLKLGLPVQENVVVDSKAMGPDGQFTSKAFATVKNESNTSVTALKRVNDDMLVVVGRGR